MYTRAKAEAEAAKQEGATPLRAADIEAALAAAKQPATRDAVCACTPLMRAWKNKPLASAFAAARYNAYVLMARVLLSGGSSEGDAQDRALAGMLWGMGDAPAKK